MSYESFSSLPPEEERHFVVFEEATQTNAKRANMMGIVAALGFGAVLVVIVLSFWGTMPKAKFDEGAAEEEAAAAAAQSAPTPAPAPVAAPTPPPADPAAAGAAPAPAGDQPAAAPAAGAAPAPATPPGATKAPPPH